MNKIINSSKNKKSQKPHNWFFIRLRALRNNLDQKMETAHFQRGRGALHILNLDTASILINLRKILILIRLFRFFRTTFFNLTESGLEVVAKKKFLGRRSCRGWSVQVVQVLSYCSSVGFGLTFSILMWHKLSCEAKCPRLYDARSLLASSIYFSLEFFLERYIIFSEFMWSHNR